MKSEIAQKIYEKATEARRVEIRKFYEIPNISIDNDTLTIHNLTNLEGGITLNLFQAKVLMLQLQEFISINEENKIIEM